LPGSSDSVYEVVYVELIDPARPTEGKTRDNFVLPSKSAKRFTVDSIELEPIDDINGGGVSGVFFYILLKNNTQFDLNVADRNLRVLLNSGALYTIDFVTTVEILLKDGNAVTIEPVEVSDAETVTEWRRFRPTNTTLKADNSAVTVSEGQDNRHYISNIDNMRDNLDALGVKSKEFLPLWMQTAQLPVLNELGYVFAVPLCYVKPGNAEEIKIKLQNYIESTTFDFKKINYDIDRYIINGTLGSNEDKYIFFANYAYNV